MNLKRIRVFAKHNETGHKHVQEVSYMDVIYYGGAFIVINEKE